jgi:hypothetical protein
MKVLDLVRYDPIRECFVLKDGNPPRVLNPWDELRLVDRPSIFLRDVRFRTKSNGTIESVEGIDYKQFGTYTKARQPNKHERVTAHAKSKTSRATDRTTDQDV